MLVFWGSIPYYDQYIDFFNRPYSTASTIEALQEGEPSFHHTRGVLELTK